jgi:multidrug resistance efflux pump
MEARKAGADASVDMARQKLDAAHYELGLRTLRSPIDAHITKMSAQVGAHVSPQAGPLFTLLPKTPPVVRAELSESMVDAVKAGMPATVSNDGGGSDTNWPAHLNISVSASGCRCVSVAHQNPRLPRKPTEKHV